MPDEVEIKFCIHELTQLRDKLHALGFGEVTARTHEFNTIYDTASNQLRNRGELLRLRRYGDKWTLTYKGVSDLTAKHKTRLEIETVVADGDAMHSILAALGFIPRFRYEKYRSEFSDPDHHGHVVLDETPIGNLGEIEGPASWIDHVARQLGVSESEYITKSYSGLFAEWRQVAGSNATDMTWENIGTAAK